MKPRAFFNHCPRCGSKQSISERTDLFECSACGFSYFFNAAAAVATFVQDVDGRWLFIRRARDPGKGKLAPPGGFVDIGETAENAARRELREELGIEVAELHFICSSPNSYLYRELCYPTLDLFFTSRLAPGAQPKALEDVENFAWFQAGEINVHHLAFPSMQAAWRKLRGV